MGLDLVFVTTWPPQQCGIATYSAQLVDALQQRGHRVTVLAENLPSDMGRATARDRVLGCWMRRSPYQAPGGLGTIANLIRSSKVRPDVVHIQHEFGLFPSTAAFWKLIAELNQIQIPVVTTFHTVTAPPLYSRFFRKTHRDPWTHAIVHSHGAAAQLYNYDTSGVHRSLIPHGIEARARDPEARRKLQLESEARYALVPGFIGPTKGIEEIFEALTHADPYVVVILAGLCRDETYLTKLEALVHAYGLDEHVIFRHGFQSERDLYLLYSAVDYVILGAGKTTPYSASGQLHTAIGYGIPVLAKNVPIYREPAAALLYNDADELGRLMAYPDKPRTSSWITGRTWGEVAMLHEDVYKRVTTK